MPETRLSFKEMCAKFDVTPRTLRYYEYIELLSPDRDGRSRSYGHREIARMTLIMRGRKFGFSLEDIRQWLLLREERGTDVQYSVFIERADEKLAELQRQRSELDETIAELEALRDETLGNLDALRQTRGLRSRS